jgi:putative transposase
MDFLADQLHDGRKIRVLTIVDQHNLEAMATEVRGSFHTSNVIEVLNRLSGFITSHL